MSNASNNVAPKQGAGGHELGVLLFPSRADAEYHMGHMWINWIQAGATERPSRGFRPDYTRIPKEFRHPAKYRDFFIKNSVPGRMVNEAVQPDTLKAMEALRDGIREKKWPIDGRRLAWLDLECFIPHGCDAVDTENEYSCDETRDDCDNCSSWALKVLRGTMDDPDFLPCGRPKRLRYVEIAIWGD